MNFRALSLITWETKRGDVEFHIRLEQDNYVIDVFDSEIDNADQAYLTSFSCETWDQVERYCRDFRLRVASYGGQDDGVTVV
jgi:hypothetical protein